MTRMTRVELPQHMAALERANEVRLARAQLKRRIAAGEITVDQVLADVPEEARSMAVSELLRAQRRWGRKRAAKLLRTTVMISENRQLERLTARQRTELAEAVRS